MDFCGNLCLLLCPVIALGYRSNKDLFLSEQKRNLILLFIIIFLMYMNILPVRMSVYYEHNWRT